jgi:hypothetical protein
MKKTPSTAKVKLGPGEYRPDIAFTQPEDLPKAKVIKRRRNYEHLACPHCGKLAFRDKVFTRQLHDVGDLSGWPHELRILYSQHYCSVCDQYFNADLSDVAPPRGHYTHRVMALAVGWWWKMACRTAPPVGISGATIVCLSPSPPSRTGWRRGGKRASERWETDYLAWALADFSGYLAMDELYDGPFCVLSIVDNHTVKRLFYPVLDHDPTHEDMIACFQRFQAVLQVRQLTGRGILPPMARPCIRRRFRPSLVQYRIKSASFTSSKT